MKVKLTLGYILAFTALVLLIGELHDWAHFFMGRWVCGCWGSRSIGKWALCSTCVAPGRMFALTWIAGPAVNYLIMWAGWQLMSPDNSPESKSLGLSLAFAALPLSRIIPTIGGISDETNFFRTGFLRPDGSNLLTVILISLLFVLASCGIVLYRSFMILPEWKLKITLFPLMLLLPPLLGLIPGSDWLTRLEQRHLFTQEYVTGIPFALLGWLLFLIVVFCLSCRSLLTLFEHKDLPL